MKVPEKKPARPLILIIFGFFSGATGLQAQTPCQSGTRSQISAFSPAEAIYQIGPPRLVASELPPPRGLDGKDEFRLDLPSTDELFRADSETAFRERIRKEAKARKITKVEFPPEAVTAPALKTAGEPVFPSELAWYVPGVVCYRPLYFEDKKTERYGNYVPGIQPLLSTAKFLLDIALLPIKMENLPPWSWECNRN